MMKYHTLSKETAEFVLQKFVAYILGDNHAKREISEEPKEFRAELLQQYFDESFDVEAATCDCIPFDVDETPGCCGVGQLCDMVYPKSIADIEITLITSEVSEYTLLKYYSVDKNLTAKLKQLGFVVDRVWHNHGSGNKVTELTYDVNKAGFFRWPTFSDIQAVLGAEAVMRELSTLMDQSSASPAKTTKRRRSAKV